MVNFKKFSDPKFLEQMEREKSERQMREEQIIAWRKITCGATGHRPDKMGHWKDALGGYDKDHPIVQTLRANTLIELERLIVEEGITRFISGGALGYDTMFFWCVNHLKKKYPHIQNVLAIPFVNQHIKWQPKQREWYFKMLEVADEVIDVARQPEYSTHEHKGSNPIPLDSFSKDKMKNRNKYMADQSRYMLAYYDGSNGGTGHCIGYAKRNIFNMPTIIRFDPRFDCKPEYY